MTKHVLKAAPGAARVVFENESVRVIVITMRKGQKIPMHSHGRGVSYSLDSGRIRSTNKEGKSSEFDVKEGEVGWSDFDGAETHAVDNLGGLLRELSIELKV